LESLEAFVLWLDHWQALAGAVLGVFGALLVALVVARAQERRERRAAAEVVHADLTLVWGAAEILNRRFPDPLNDDRSAQQQVANLLRERPVLSPLFDASLARLLGLDDVLDHHLHFFRADASSFERGLERLRHSGLQTGGFLMSEGRFTSSDRVDLFLTLTSFQNAAWRAGLAEALIRDLIFRPFAWSRRLIRRIRRAQRRRELRAIDDRHNAQAADRAKLAGE
jgi:hypothetical protein